METKEITLEELDELLLSGVEDGHYEPKGLFIAEDKQAHSFYAVDNSSGHAWLEEFSNIGECILWLIQQQ